MGNRGSITIKGEKLPILFCHWCGDKKQLQKLANTVLKRMVSEDPRVSTPYSRKDPPFVMAALIAEAVNQLDDSAYVGLTPMDGDNSDNGHFVLDLKTGKVERAKE